MNDDTSANPATKACKACLTQIPIAATRCPQCGAFQQLFLQRYKWPLVVAAILICLVGGYFVYVAYLAQPHQSTAQETQAAIDEVSKLTTLPPADLKNGEPTLATVIDKTKLTDQPFFKNAQNGDKVLIYSKAKVSYLYRPSTNRLINQAPVTIGAGQEVNVAVLNGTPSTAASGRAIDALMQAYPNINVVSTGNAASDNYARTIVVDLNNNPDAATSLAQSLHATVSPLPAGEPKPSDADFLVIVGANQL